MPNLESPEWLKATVAGSPVGVDRDKNVLRGYVVAQEGPFKSQGRGEFDVQSLQMLVKLGNAKSGGLKSRFTHPDASNDGLGKYLGRAKNLRMDKAVDARTGKTVAAVRADLHFDKTALEEPPGGGKPYGIYVMDLADSDHEALSSSIVVKPDEEYRRKKDGTLEMGPDGEPLPPLWRPRELHASDIVDTGDAVDSLLSGDVDEHGIPLTALWRADRLLSAVFEGKDRNHVEARLAAYMERYLSRTFGEREVVKTPNIDERRKAMEAMNVRMRGLKK